MKKWVLCIIALFSLISCNKDDNVKLNGYSKEEKEVLNILQGKWRSVNDPYPEELSFTLFGSNVRKNGEASAVMYFHGNVIRKVRYLNKDWETLNMYFYVTPTKREIGMYKIKEDGTFSIGRTMIYDYRIIDNNMIQLHNKSLSWTNTYKYKRIE